MNLTDQSNTVLIPHGLATIAAGRDILPTNEAAALLRFAPQTLRKWACYDTGPIRPIRIAGRLRWRTADLLKLINGEAA